MVKGISRQVVVVHSPEEKLFEQAIFILKEGTGEVSDETLLKEAQQLIRRPVPGRRTPKFWQWGLAWACGGAAVTGLAWLISAFL